MMKKQDPFRNSELDRAKPSKRHFFRALVNDSFKRHRSDTGLVEDRTSSVTIVRIIVGLLMIHLIIIGGVLLRGKMVRDGAGLASSTSISPPPTPPAPPTVATEQPALPEALPQPRPAVVTRPSVGHITQALQEDDGAEVVDDEPVIVSHVSADPSVPMTPAHVASTPAAPEVAPAHKEAPAEPMHHRVAQGDTLYRIANQYHVSEAAIRAANPTTLGQGVLRAGTTLVIPTEAAQVIPAAQVPRVVTGPAPRPAVPTAAAPAAPRPAAPATPRPAAPAAPAAASYVVSRGDTLSSISRKTGVSVADLMRLNNIKQANRIRIGQKLRLR